MKYFLIAGEASGDLHASNLMRELKIRDPKAEFSFLGGDLMALQGSTPIINYRQMAFMGIINVLRNSRTALKNLEKCKQAVLAFQPDVVVLVDYPSFNLRIARFVKENLKKTPVFYYISPKIWAWKEFRIKAIKRYIDKMFTILPFETEFYKKHNYQVEYVGNPTVDSVSARENQHGTLTEFRVKNNLPEKPFIALLAGSRKQEISACLPTMAAAAGKFPDYQIVVAGAPGIDADFYPQLIPNQDIKIVFDQTYDLLAHARAAVVNSGTATLETALIGTPQVVVYHVAFGRAAMALKKLFINVKYISLVNLIAEKEAVKELVAHHFTEENIKQELERLLFDNSYRKQMHENYRQIADKLGEPGAAKKAADGIICGLQSVFKRD